MDPFIIRPIFSSGVSSETRLSTRFSIESFGFWNGYSYSELLPHAVNASRAVIPIKQLILLITF